MADLLRSTVCCIGVNACPRLASPRVGTSGPRSLPGACRPARPSKRSASATGSTEAVATTGTASGVLGAAGAAQRWRAGNRLGAP